MGFWAKEIVETNTNRRKRFFIGVEIMINTLWNVNIEKFCDLY
jgi:hypothetical protein